MKRFLALTLVLCFGFVGCTGSFALTKKVYDFHRSQEDKWMDELMFLAVVILPIYQISTFADAIVFNSIEFWTGENPVTAEVSTDKKLVSEKGEATLSLNGETGRITINAKLEDGSERLMVLEKTDSGVLAKDINGNLLYASVADEAGNVSVYDSEVNLVKAFDAR